jgi:hypothetical protein
LFIDLIKVTIKISLHKYNISRRGQLGVTVMATEGSVYQRKDGRWVAQYRDAKDKVRYVYRKTKAEAKKALREALQDRDETWQAASHSHPSRVETSNDPPLFVKRAPPSCCYGLRSCVTPF